MDQSGYRDLIDRTIINIRDLIGREPDPFDVEICKKSDTMVEVINIYGVEVLNTGSGISIDDFNSDTQITRIGRSISDPIEYIRIMERSFEF